MHFVSTTITEHSLDYCFKYHETGCLNILFQTWCQQSLLWTQLLSLTGFPRKARILKPTCEDLEKTAARPRSKPSGSLQPWWEQKRGSEGNSQTGELRELTSPGGDREPTWRTSGRLVRCPWTGQVVHSFNKRSLSTTKWLTLF